MRTAAIVPVAGLSSRMGAFKPLLLLDGQPMVRQTVASILNSGVQDISVATGHNGKAVQAALDDLAGQNAGIRYIANPDFATTDMLHSVKLGLQSLLVGEQIKHRLDAVFVLPGDIPLVAPATFARLRQCALENGLVSAVIPTYNAQTGHPILIKRECFEPILTSAATGGLRSALAEFPQYELEVADRKILCDADTPADFKKLQYMVM